MKLRASGIAWLLPLLLTACIHRGHQKNIQPPAPPVAVEPVPPPPEVKIPPKEEAATNQHATSTTTQKTSQKPKPAIRHSRPPNGTAEQVAKGATPSSSDPQPSSGMSGGVSAIGQLTSEDSAELSRQTRNEIISIERNLYEIDNKLSAQEQKTTAQIREYLKQARAALASGDVDGAHTLTAKAKLLLNELTP